jgi:hypothetical protein
MPKRQTDGSRNRWANPARIIFAISLALGIMGGRASASSGKFSLLNRATETIVRASVTICGQTIELANIPPEVRAEKFYRVTSDSHYSIQVEFKSGKKLLKETGYVTNGASFDDEIVVTGSTIEVKNRSIK